MGGILQSVLDQACEFVRSDHAKAIAADLIQAVDRVTASELNYRVDAVFANGRPKSSGCATTRNAPCSYTEIFENDDIHMSIFALQPECEIPLHDHPGMFGFIKVIHGKLSVTTYTKCQKLPDDCAVPTCLAATGGKLPPAAFPTIRMGPRVVSVKDGVCTLTPTENNYHRVMAVDGPAAFFDLLLPPYSPPTRDCTYYALLPDASPSGSDGSGSAYFWLTPAYQPSTYFCDVFPYSGKSVSLAGS